MAKGVSRRPVTVEARVRSRVSPHTIFVGKIGTGTDFFHPVLRYSPVNFIPPVIHYTETSAAVNVWQFLSNEQTGLSMVKAVNCRPVTSEARVRSRFSLYGIFRGKSGTGTGFFHTLL
jgi:hypothetical protein